MQKKDEVQLRLSNNFLSPSFDQSIITDIKLSTSIFVLAKCSLISDDRSSEDLL